MRGGWNSGQGTTLLGSRRGLFLMFLKTAQKATCWLAARNGIDAFLTFLFPWDISLLYSVY